MFPEIIAPADNRAQALIGTGMRLLETYDPDQSWFPFMTGSVINVWKNEPEPVNHSRVTQYNNQRHAKMSRDGRVLYKYEKDVPQWPLPFPMTKALSKSDFKRLESAHFPCWDRVDGQPIVIPVRKDLNKEVRAWCVEHCVGRFHLRPHTLFLEKEEDMVMAAVFWKGPEKVPYKTI